MESHCRSAPWARCFPGGFGRAHGALLQGSVQLRSPVLQAVEQGEPGAVSGVRVAQLRDLRLVLREGQFGQPGFVDQAPPAILVPTRLLVDGQGFGPVACPVAEQQFRQPRILEAEITAAERFGRSEEHTSELQSLMRISYAVFCLNKN